MLKCDFNHDSNKTGGTDQDTEGRLGKARLAFRAMDKLWTLQIFGRATKVNIFNSSVKASYFMRLSPVQIHKGQ